MRKAGKGSNKHAWVFFVQPEEMNNHHVLRLFLPLLVRGKVLAKIRVHPGSQTVGIIVSFSLGEKLSSRSTIPGHKRVITQLLAIAYGIR